VSSSATVVTDCIIDEYNGWIGGIQVVLSTHRFAIYNNRFTCSADRYTIDSGATDTYIDDPMINSEQVISPRSSIYKLSFDTAFSSLNTLSLVVQAHDGDPTAASSSGAACG